MVDRIIPLFNKAHLHTVKSTNQAAVLRWLLVYSCIARVTVKAQEPFLRLPQHTVQGWEKIKCQTSEYSS